MSPQGIFHYLVLLLFEGAGFLVGLATVRDGTLIISNPTVEMSNCFVVSTHIALV